MEMVFTVVDLNGKEYTTAPLDSLDSWDEAARVAALYARKFWREAGISVKIKSIERIDV